MKAWICLNNPSSVFTHLDYLLLFWPASWQCFFWPRPGKWSGNKRPSWRPSLSNSQEWRWCCWPLWPPPGKLTWWSSGFWGREFCTPCPEASTSSLYLQMCSCWGICHVSHTFRNLCLWSGFRLFPALYMRAAGTPSCTPKCGSSWLRWTTPFGRLCSRCRQTGSIWAFWGPLFPPPQPLSGRRHGSEDADLWAKTFFEEFVQLSTSPTSGGVLKVSNGLHHV